MTQGGIAEGALREVVAKARDRDPDARVIAVRAEGYEGKPTLALDGGEQAQVHWCDSVLEFRERLAEATEEAVVLVTACDERELGEDAIGLVARQRLERIGVWEPVKAIFKASSISPKVNSEKWLAEALLRNIPAGGFTPAPNGLLTYEHALEGLSKSVLGSGEPTTAALLLALASGVRSSERDNNRVLDALGEFHSTRLGPVGSVLLQAAATGHATHVIPLGLAAQVVFATGPNGEADPAQREAMVRLERFTGGVRVSADAGTAWGAAAARLMSDATDDEARVWATDAERLLGELGVESLARFSDTLPSGFSARVEFALIALGDWLQDEGDEARRAALDAVTALGQHLRASQQSVGGLEMIARLVQFAHHPEPPVPGSLREASYLYVREGGPLDRARQALDGDFQSEAERQLFTAIKAAVDPRRERRAADFARLLAAGTAADQDDGLLCVERIQSEVVAPMARNQLLLVVVLDGMSEAAFQSIGPSVVTSGWTEVTDGGEERKPALATLPSLTKVSRASLLSGKLTSGLQSVETAGFNEALRDVGVARLFHKADLRSEDELRDAIADDGVRVVGVVVNAIDDMLDRGDQVAGEWTLERVGPLEGLLDAAGESGRVVILASDHGHVIERDSELRTYGEGGERWRPLSSGDVGDGELLFKGRRVLEGDGTLVAPAIEGLRYKPKSSGYHGGGTPQEVIAPLGVFVPVGLEIEGFSEAVSPKPDWWGLGATVIAAEPPKSTPTRPRPRGPEEQEALFGTKGGGTEELPTWIADLLSSQRYKAQRERTVRPPSDERVATTLAELDRRAGVAAVELISEALGVPASRGRTLIASMQAVLNVDGYGILALDPRTNEVKLNRPMLATQFEL